MRKAVILAILVLLALIVNSLFIVKQGTEDILFRFGQVVKNKQTQQALVYLPGLHVKIPFIDSVKILPTTIQTTSIPNETLVTENKQNVVLSTYLKWRIVNPYLYYVVSDGGNKEVVQNALTQVVMQLLNESVSHYSMANLLSGASTLSNDLKTVLNQGSDNKDISKIVNFSAVLSQVNSELLKNIDTNSVAVLGIQLVDFKIGQILPPTDQLADTFSQMGAKLNDESNQLQMKAKEEAEKNKEQAQQQATKILGNAQQQVAKIRGAAEAASAKQYVSAFKNYADFYGFIRGLEIYEKSFESGHNTIILTPDGNFFRYINKLSH